MGMSGRSSSSSSSSPSSSSSLSMRFLIAAFIVYSLSPQTICNAARQKCAPSSCGHIRNISYPFRLKGDPRRCGDSRYTLSCENNKTILNIRLSGDYYVQAINYHNQTIRVVDPGLDKSNCSSLPLHSLALSSAYNFPDNVYYQIPIGTNCIRSSTYSLMICTGIGPTDLTFLKCPSPMNSSLYVDAAPCFPVESTSTSSSSMSSSQPKSYGYVKIGGLRVGEMKDGCSIERMTYAYLFDGYNASYKSIHNSLVYGFELEYTLESAFFCGGQWSYNYKCYPYSVPGLFRFVWALIQGFFVSGDHIDVDFPLPSHKPRQGWILAKSPRIEAQKVALEAHLESRSGSLEDFGRRDREIDESQFWPEFRGFSGETYPEDERSQGRRGGYDPSTYLS